MALINRTHIAAILGFLRGSSLSCGGLSVLGIAVLLLSTSPILAQQAEPTDLRHEHTGQRPDVQGYPIDWSNKHVHYRPGISLQEIRKIERDPRYWHQKAVTEHNAALANVRGKFDLDEFLDSLKDKRNKKKKKGDPLEVDWAVSLGTAAVAQNMSPAKFSYTGPASCSDWVAFALNATPSASQATLFAVNNLYGTANGCTANPAVLFSYQTLGAIATSPVISFFDSGLQVAYVDNEAGKATLVVLKYKSGDGTAAGAPVAVPGTGSQVRLQYSATTNTNSSPYIDFASDSAYVGDDSGKLYKISPIFGGGTPAQVWVTTLAGKLTGPVLDQLHDVVVVGSDNGKLYAQKVADGTALNTALQAGTGASTTVGIIVDAPVLVGGSTTDAFVTTDCNNVDGQHSGLVEAAVGPGTTFSLLATRTIGNGHITCSLTKLHAPALDDASYNFTAGNIYVCGTTSVNNGGPSNAVLPPTIYSFTFDPSTGALSSTPTDSVAPSNAVAADQCSPMTYFTSNSTQKIFWGMGSTDGTVNSTTVVAAGTLPAPAGITQDTVPPALGGTSGIVVDNASATSSLANIYFSAQAAGNITAPIGGTAGSCKSFTVSGANTAAGVVTLTVTAGGPHNFAIGNTIVVSGFTSTAASYNGTFVVSGIGATTITYSDSLATTVTSQAGHTASWGTCGFQLTQTGLN